MSTSVWAFGVESDEVCFVHGVLLFAKVHRGGPQLVVNTFLRKIKRALGILPMKDLAELATFSWLLYAAAINLI
jgi:hypothetical protein